MSISPEIPKPPEMKLSSVRESLDVLKNDVESTQKAREFLVRKDFSLELETRIDALNLPPQLPHRKRIYEQMLFGQKNAAKIILTAELAKFLTKNPAASDAALATAAGKFVEGWLAELAKLDRNRDGKLNYEEIIPRDFAGKDFIERVFGTAPFFVALENNPLFQNREPSVERNVPGKIEFVKKYLVEFAEKLIDPATQKPVGGGGRQLARILETANLSVVGGKFLSNEDFGKMWRELLAEKKAVAKVFAEGEGREQKKFERRLDKTSLQIRTERVRADAAMSKLLMLTENNPHSFTARKFGDMTSTLLYFGRDALIGTIGLNAVLSGFSPEKMLKNPVMWGVGGILLLAKKHFDPDFLTSSPLAKIERDELKKSAAEAPPAVKNWLAKFSKKELDPERPLGKLLAEKGRREITSDELVPFLAEDDLRPMERIAANSDEARKLFLLFVACRQREINPKKLFDE